MRRAVVWTNYALNDLLAISRTIATDNPTAAARVAAEMRISATNLGDMATGRSGRVTGTYEKLVTGLP